jgi:peroxiredoxin
MSVTLLVLALAPTSLAQEAEERDLATIGHSIHGEAFDEGPRQKPWRIEGIGAAHFPITTSVPEVQEWFDQGVTLLHSFWFYEAERSFRWCLKLDPDCAMAWWGLAQAVGARGAGGERGEPILREAILRKDTVSERERMYIEAWEHAFQPELSGAVEVLDEETRDGREELAGRLEDIVLAYPDDVEAKAFLALNRLYGENRYGNGLILREILETAPEHPGAHHYNIHNWDGPEGSQALDSCESYGRIAWNIGHANHMPGHIYSGIGMWHEAAIWMDRATRSEKEYMRERMIFPFNHWNHAHNRNYLSFIQEQLGRFALAQDGGRQLLAAPLDPKYNDPDEQGFSVYGQGMRAVVRGLIKFERWDQILEEDFIPWRDTQASGVWRDYAEALAHLQRGDRVAAVDSLITLKEKTKADDLGWRLKRDAELMLLELRGLVALDGGDDIEAIALLGEGAELQAERYERSNDPPSYPRVLFNVLGELHLERGGAAVAAQCFERTLEFVRNDAFALSGLARAYHATGERERANEAYGRLLHVWSGADRGLRWLEDARALGLEAAPLDLSAKAQRDYGSVDLADFGPGHWVPYPAPELDALDEDEETVTLEEYAGQLVLLVFFLGEECPHCVDQLIAIDERIEEFRKEDVQVLAISGDTPEMNRASQQMGELAFRLLSDEDFDNAKRYHSYDDFEDMELHSTILIDGDGRVRWARSGGAPFMELDFLLEEIRRVNAEPLAATAMEASASSGGGGR